MFSKIRKILFWIFTAIYLISAPLIIIFAFGYRWEYKEATLRETGIISLKSYPEKADIYLNNTLYESKTPSWISGLNPAKYKIKVIKDGYFEWEKLLEVKPKMVTKVEEILLVPTHVTPEPIFYKGEVLDFIPLKGYRGIIALLIDSSGKSNFFSVTSQEIRPKPLVGKILELNDTRFVRSIKIESTSKNNSFLLVKKDSDYYIIDLSKESLILVNKNFGIKPDLLKWSETDDNILYFLQDKFIGKIDVNGNTAYLSKFRADSFDLLENRIYLFNKEDKSISFIDSDLKEINIINKDDYLADLLFNKYKADNYRILMSTNFLNIFKDSVAVLLTDNGDLFLMRPFYFLDKSVKNVMFSTNESRIVYYNNKTIFYCNLEPEVEAGDVYFSPTPQKEEIFAIEEPVENIFFFIDNNHVIFNEGKRFVITELDGRGKRNLYEIYKRSVNGKFFFSNPEERLYFIDIDKNTGKRNLFKIDFYKHKRI